MSYEHDVDIWTQSSDGRRFWKKVRPEKKGEGSIFLAQTALYKLGHKILWPIGQVETEKKCYVSVRPL